MSHTSMEEGERVKRADLLDRSKQPHSESDEDRKEKDCQNLLIVQKCQTEKKKKLKQC